MNFLKFNGVKVRYYWYTDHQLYFTANSAFLAFGYKGWWNYMQRHGGDFMLPDQNETEYPYTYAVSWDALLRFRQNCSGNTKSNNWWIDHHLLYEDFIQHIEKYVLHKKVNAKPQVQPVAQPVDLDSPAHKHPATVAALQSLPKAKLPELDSPTRWVKLDTKPSDFIAPSDDPWAQEVKPAAMSVTPPAAKPRQCPSTVEALFDKVTATLNRHKGGEDSFPRIRDYWNESTEEAVALKMALLKIARIENGISVEDSYVDAIGYLALAYNKFKEREQ